MAAHTDFLSHLDTTDPPNTECPVCVEGIEEHICVKIVNIEGCTHLIGLECLKALFEHMPDAERKCPLCRTQWVPEHIAPYVPQRLNDIHDRRREWDALHDPVLGHGHGGHRNCFCVDMQLGGPDRDAFMQLSNRRRDRDAERHATLVALLANDPGVGDPESMAYMLANVPPLTDADRDELMHFRETMSDIERYALNYIPNMTEAGREAFGAPPIGAFPLRPQIPQRGSSLHHTGSSRRPAASRHASNRPTGPTRPTGPSRSASTFRPAVTSPAHPTGHTRSGFLFRPAPPSRPAAPSRSTTSSLPAAPFNPHAPSRLTITALAGSSVTDRSGHPVIVPVGHTGVFRFDASGRFLGLDMQQNDCASHGHGAPHDGSDRRHGDGRHGGRDTRHGHGRRHSEHP
jgi:hypothetical protein